MKKTLTALSFSAILLSALVTTAQTTDWCSSGKGLAQKLQNDPQLKQEFAAYMNQLAQPDNSRASNTIYIPVVFHVVHHGVPVGSQENITDAQCISQIDALNLLYNFGDPNIPNVPSVFAPLVANCNIHFCLAKFDENGDPTTGIIRHQMSQLTWDTENDIDNTLKPATIWDHTRYLNIWSVRMGGTGTGTLLGDGVLAYAELPYTANASNDGVVARFNTIGTTGTLLAGYNKGKTVVHEVGHYLGLLHIWGFNANCGDAGDYIADTPDQADLNFGCPTYPHVSCTSATGDMFMNYMDYTDDGCSAMFSNGQATVMHTILNGTRASIKTASTQCFYDLDATVKKIVLPNDTICSLNFNPVILVKNSGATTITSGKFYLQFDGGGASIINWNGSIDPQAELQITLPTQTVVNGTHAFTVTFTEINGTAGDNYLTDNSLSNQFYAYDGGAGETLPYSEGFETIFPAGNWTLLNPNHDVTWIQNSNASGYSTSVKSGSINNLGYSTNPNFQKKDALVTDAYDFTNVPKPELKFDVAYAQYSSTRWDSLNVYYSIDCGSNWTKIWNQRGSDLATAPDQTTSFIPSNAQWKTVSVPVLQATGQPKVTFKFENVSGWGNVLYLDNINLQNNPSLAVNEIQKAVVKIFPNPASGLMAVRLPSNHSFKRISMFNSLGEKVYDAPVTDDAVIISVSSFANGLYFLHLNGETSWQTEKVLIQQQ